MGFLEALLAPDVPSKASLAGSNVRPRCSRDIAWLSVYSPASLLRVGQQTFPGVPKVVEGQHAEWPCHCPSPHFLQELRQEADGKQDSTSQMQVHLDHIKQKTHLFLLIERLLGFLSFLCLGRLSPVSVLSVG